MRIVRIELEGPSASAERMQAAAYALGVQGLEIVDEESGAPEGRTIVRLYLPEGSATDRAVRALRDGLSGIEVGLSPVVEPSADVSPRHLVTLGRRFFVSPDARRSNDRIRLLVDPSAAFGDGVHPTTRLVVDTIEARLTTSVPRRALDVGSGTGVLSLVALELGVREVVATDVDALARRATNAAAARHGFSSRIAVRARLPDDTFPLVVANLYRDVLLGIAPRLAARVSRRGTLIVSGFGVCSRAEVLAAFASEGLRPVATRSRASWCVATLHRP